MKSILTFVIVFLSGGQLQAQNENNVWYFGLKAGIKFKDGKPTALLDGAMETLEGCSSISDNEGNILVYTNGQNVWNKHHTLLENGSGLKGDVSSTQSALLVRCPGSLTQIYLFTTNAMENGVVNELNYSIVDISHNGESGVVAAKNILLHKPVTEKITAIKHSNHKDVWIITHEWGTNAFYSYLLTSSGINATPVQSLTGTVLTEEAAYSYPCNSQDQQGSIKASPDGSKIAIALKGSGVVELFDFNNETGIVKNPTRININSPYGIEFSPDVSKLYVSTMTGTIYQYHLERCAPGIIKGNGILVGRVEDEFLGSMQLGPDKKIYVARYFSRYLGVINYPNKDGIDCSFNKNGIFLGGRESVMGLPNVEQSSFFIPDFEYGSACLNESTVFKLTDQVNADSVIWIIGNNPIKTYKGVSVAHKFTLPGTYSVEADIYFNGSLTTSCRNIRITNHEAFDLNLGTDTTLCKGASLQLDVSPIQGEYHWQDGSSRPYYTITKPGLYWVEINREGCTNRDSILISDASSSLKPILGNDTIICDNNTIRLDASPLEGPFHWQDESAASYFYISKPGIYWVEINVNGCTIRDSIVITSNGCPVFVPNVFTPNDDGINETFYIKGFRENWTLQIANRWGEVVFATTNYHNDWTGSGLSSGLYFYMIYDDKKQKLYNGWIHLLR